MNVPVTKYTLARLIALVLGGFILAYSVPAMAVAVAPEAGVATAIIVGLIVAFLVQQADVRRRELQTAIYVELNKLRRVYHLAKNLSSISPRFRSWFTDLHGFLMAYLSSFSDKDMRRYKETNIAYRKLSYHIYTIPELETAKERALFGDLLKTTSVVAESRQKIKELLVSRLSPYSWVVVLLLVSGFAVATLASMTESSASRLVAGIAIGSALLVVDLLWEVDTMSSEMKPWAQRYVNNIGKLEYRRDETA